MKKLSAVAGVMLMLGLTVAAHAQTTQYVVNGSFEHPGIPEGFTSGSYSGAATYSNTTGVPTGWTTFGGGTLGPSQWNGYLLNSTANNTSILACSFADVSCNGSSLKPGGVQADPNGGFFVTMDGDPNIETGIEQTLTGLTIGTQYLLSFDYGAIDRTGNSGAYTNNLLVDVGDSSFQTQTFSEASHAFSGWFIDNTYFTATSSSEVLSFLSQGTPAGAPPSAVLDGVSVTAVATAGAVPEPAAWLMMLTGFAVVGVTARRRRQVFAQA